MSDSTSWRPDHRYIPGQTERHAEDLFDWIKHPVDTLDVDDLADSLAWRMGQAFLQDGYFWEAHEVLEAVWLRCPPNSAERYFVRANIQLANAGLKRKMGRPEAATKLIQLAAKDWSESFLRCTGSIWGVNSSGFAKIMQYIT